MGQGIIYCMYYVCLRIHIVVYVCLHSTLLSLSNSIVIALKGITSMNKQPGVHCDNDEWTKWRQWSFWITGGSVSTSHLFTRQTINTTLGPTSTLAFQWRGADGVVTRALSFPDTWLPPVIFVQSQEDLFPSATAAIYSVCFAGAGTSDPWPPHDGLLYNVGTLGTKAYSTVDLGEVTEDMRVTLVTQNVSMYCKATTLHFFF